MRLRVSMKPKVGIMRRAVANLKCVATLYRDDLGVPIKEGGVHY